MSATKERPMLFNGAMVRALLSNNKTQTRRPLYVLTKNARSACFDRRYLMPFDLPPVGIVYTLSNWRYAEPGDKIWVRETFFAFGRWETRFSAKKGRDEWHFIDMTRECGRAYQYAADNHDVVVASGYGPLPGWYKRPAIFMPRWASRITLEIVSVRVERLQEISEADAIAEGAPGGHGAIPGYSYSATSKEHYQHFWEQINGAGSWDANPWVWVIEFKRIEL